MLVSVLVPVYNVGKYIVRCAHSLFAQTFQDIEYIFVDDCSPDNSIKMLEEVLKQYPTRISKVKIIRHSSNRGLAAARNTALEHASGQYILHVDSDDFLELNAVELLHNAAMRQQADVVIFDIKKIFHHKEVCCRNTIKASKQEYIVQLLLREVDPGVCGKFFHRHLFTDHGISFIEGLNFGEDYAISPRLMYFADKIVKLDEYLYNYIQYNATSYVNSVSDLSIQNVVTAVGILIDFFQKQADSVHYDSCFPEMKLRNKIMLLKLGNKRQRQFVSTLYPGVRLKKEYSISFPDRIVLELGERQYWRCLDRFVKMGLTVKKIRRDFQ